MGRFVEVAGVGRKWPRQDCGETQAGWSSLERGC